MRLFSDSSAPQRTSAVANLALPCRGSSGPGLAFVGLSSPAGALRDSARGAMCTGAHVGAGPLLGRLPIAHPRNALRAGARKNGALTTVCVFDQMTKGFGQLFGSQGKNDVDALKKILRDDQYSAVMDALNKVVDANKKELSEVERKTSETSRKLQKEINSYTNQVRDLEYQLIMAASEVTELEEQLTTRTDTQLLPATPLPVPPPTNENHPIFGKFLADFGYKKIYSADPAKLYASTPIYKKQRTFRTERASAIARAKSLSGVTGWPGTISVVEYNESSDKGTKSVLVDGQHRLGAFTLLSRQMKARNPEAPLPPGMTEILVEVYPALDEQKAAEVFTEINKAEPCKLIDLPQSKVPANTKKIIDGAADKLRRRFSGMFKPSSACRTPHMNIDNLRDELFQSGVASKKGFTTADELLNWMVAKNDALCNLADSEWKPRRRTRAKMLPKALEKAKQQQFYLGLEWDWLNEEADDAVSADSAATAADWEDGDNDEDGSDFFGASVK